MVKLDRQKRERELNTKREVNENIKCVVSAISLISPVIFRDEGETGDINLGLTSAPMRDDGTRNYATPMQYLIDKTFIDMDNVPDDLVVKQSMFDGIIDAESVKLYQSAVYDMTQLIVWIVADIMYNIGSSGREYIEGESDFVLQKYTKFAYDVAYNFLAVSGINERNAIILLSSYDSYGALFLSSSFMSVLINRLMSSNNSPVSLLINAMSQEDRSALSNYGIDRYMAITNTIFSVISERAWSARQYLKRLGIENGDNTVKDLLINGEMYNL